MTHDHDHHRHQHDHHAHSHKHADGTDCHCDSVTDEGSAIDPVCGMSVEKSSSSLTAEYRGETYYFCSPGCRSSFVANPGAYIG
jgi:YHS domain-containing protein